MRRMFLAYAMLAGLAVAGEEPNLRVVVSNVKTDQGSVVVWVYEKPDDWLSDRFRTQKSIIVAGHRVNDTVTLELKLPAGEYALSVFQDVDDDGKLARNFFGVSSEPAGVSNNAVARFGPPSYKDAKFRIDNVVVEQSITLK